MIVSFLLMATSILRKQWFSKFWINTFPKVLGGRSITGKSQDEYVEAIVCNISALGENEMKVFDVESEGKVLLTKQDGRVFATGTLCSHYKAPLITGALGKGKVRCPWHGACFDLATGDIEDFPGLDSIPSYEVKILEDGGVQIKAKKTDLHDNKRVKGMCKLKNKAKNYVIIGGGAAGAKCVETLRQEGCDGQIIMVCQEPHNPYDRIKVTKVLDADPSKLQLRTDNFYKDSNIELKKGVSALKVGPTQKQVHLSNGETINYEKLFIATGCKPRKLKIPGVELTNVLTMRNVDDTMSLAKYLGTNQDKHIVISGSSFVAMESAAVCISKAKSVTVVMRSALPLQLFGQAIGERIAALFKSKGVILEPNLTIRIDRLSLTLEELRSHFEELSEHKIAKSDIERLSIDCYRVCSYFARKFSKLEGASGQVSDAVLSDGRKLPADIVILAVGSTFNTEFLQGSSVDVNPEGVVPTNEFLETSLKHVYAGGDIAFAPVYVSGGKRLAIGHWQIAQYHGHIAAKNMLGQKVQLHTVPFFWANLFGTSFRYAGHCEAPDDIVVVGDLEELKFTAYFCESDEVKAVVSTSNVTAAFAEYISAGNTLSKRMVQTDSTSWLSQVPKGKL